MDTLTDEKEKSGTDGPPLVLVAINDDDLWQEISTSLERHFKVIRETDGVRAIDVLLLHRPVAVIAETGLPGLSGILLARLIGNNRLLTRLPVALIMSRQYLIEEFWAKESGSIVNVPRDQAGQTVDAILEATRNSAPIPDEVWDQAEKVILAQGGAAVGVAADLESQLIGASILARLGEIEIGAAPDDERNEGTIPTFIGKALSALASVLEFAQAGVTIFETGSIYMVENIAFEDVLDLDWFVGEIHNSTSLYADRIYRSAPLEPVMLPPVQHELPGPREPASTYFALPLTGRSGVYGLLSIMTYKQIAVREYYLHTLSLIGAQLAVTVERAFFYEEVRRLSVTDSLTGLSNHRAIFSRLEEEFRRSTRYRSPLSVAVVDLDDFKLINDRHGHYAGDAVLKDIAAIVKQSVREVDLAGRWGGEEMALLFPETNLKGALIACERVRKQVEDHVTRFQGLDLNVTISIGLATLEPKKYCPRSPDALVALADSAMYLAKSRGKNRIAVYTDLEDFPTDKELSAPIELKPSDYTIL